MRRLVSGRWAAIVLSIIISATGCDQGPPTGLVTGTVKTDGQVPPPGSSITFFPADGKSPSTGAVLNEGRYSVRVPVGMARVEIRAPRPAAKSSANAEGPGAEGGLIEESLPEKYNDQSELTLDVKSGSNEKNWELTGKR
jgi:hypothetical protein